MLSSNELVKYTPWLISVAKTGSSTLPWINNPRDTDYIFYVTSNASYKEIIKLHKQKPNNECWLINRLDSTAMCAKLYSYEYKFLVPVYGNEFPEYDVLMHTLDYKNKLVHFGLNKDYDPSVKQWYHVLTGIYIMQNGKYEFTDEQIQNIRLCHDKQMTKEIFNFIQEQLRIYEEELSQNKTKL